MKGVGKTKLRIRPENIRFYVLGVSMSDIHLASTHKGLELAIDKGVHTLYISDLKTNAVIKEHDPLKFLNWWAEHYNDSTTNYS